MLFFRFGEVPSGGRSVNFLKLTGRQREDFHDDLLFGGYDVALSRVPSDALEPGVSAFSLSSGRPVLSNFKLLSTFTDRVDKGDPIFLIDGSVVGTGEDGEPLVSSISSIREISCSKDELVSAALDELKQHFQTVKAPKAPVDDRSGYRVHYFWNDGSPSFVLRGWEFSGCLDDFVKSWNS